MRRRVGPVAGEAVTLNNLGLVHDDLGMLAQAAEYYEQALPLRHAAGDRQARVSPCITWRLLDAAWPVG